MNFDQTVRAFGALGQPARLAAFRELARAGERGLCAGELSRSLDAAPSTLSFHLADLVEAQLVRSWRDGRSIRYAVRAESMQALLFFLGEDCCQGREDLCPAPTSRITKRAAVAEGELPVVLFLCTENSARSQLAEALLRHRAGSRFVARSAGLRPSRVHPLARAALEEVGVSTDGLRAKDVGELLGKAPIARAFVLCESADRERRGIVGLSDCERWILPDPAAATGPRATRLAAFRAVRDELQRRIDDFVARPRMRATRSRRHKDPAS